MARQAKNYLQFRPGVTEASFSTLIAENDTRLSQYYIGRERYVDRVLDFHDPASVLIGPKGMGKSAVLQMIRLEKAADRKRIIDISPDDMAFSSLSNVSASLPELISEGKQPHILKTLWDFVLVTEIMTREHSDKNALIRFFVASLGGKYEKDVRRLLSLVTDDAGVVVSFTDRILQLVEEVEVAGNLSGVSGSATIKMREEKRKEQLRLLSIVNQVSKQLPDKVKNEYYILIDDLDLHWRNTPAENMFIAALLWSARKLSRPPNIKVAISLRDNIYRNIPLEDKDKFRDCIVEIEWSKHDIKQIVQKRLASTLSINESDVWNSVMPRSSFDTMWAECDGVPRSLLRVVAIAINVAKKDGATQVSNAHVDIALQKFSGERLDNLDSEYQYTYPGLRKMLRHLRGVSKELPYSRLEELVIQIELDIESDSEVRYSWARGMSEHPNKLAEIMMKLGILQYKSNRTAMPAKFDELEHSITEQSWFAISPQYWGAFEVLNR